jgi:hypothetical protein
LGEVELALFLDTNEPNTVTAPTWRIALPEISRA